MGMSGCHGGGIYNKIIYIYSILYLATIGILKNTHTIVKICITIESKIIGWQHIFFSFVHDHCFSALCPSGKEGWYSKYTHTTILAQRSGELNGYH